MCIQILWYKTVPTPAEFTETQTHMLTLRLSYHYSILCETIPPEGFCGVDFKLGQIHEIHCLWFYSSKTKDPSL